MSTTRRSLLMRLVLGGLAAAGAAWWAGAVTMSLVLAVPAPQAALAAWRTSPAESGVAARLMIGRLDRNVVARARDLSRAALARSVVNVEAVRAFALAEAAQGHLASARADIDYAEQLSRRDLQTQLWMIEDRVQAGDVPGALVYYDRAMQTTSESRDVLSPILAAAADNPAITRPLAHILRTRPEWWPNFLGDFVERTHSPSALGVVTDALDLRPAVPVERERLSAILARYVALGEVASGRRLFNRLTGTPPGPVVEGGFERDPALPPFGWQLTDTGSNAGVREMRTGATGRWALTLDGGNEGEAARQLLALAPGRYELRFTAGNVRPGFAVPPTVAIRCFPADAPIGESDLPATRGSMPVRVPFTVPNGCPGQMLVVRTARAAGYLDDKPWIDDVAVVTAGGGSGGH